MTLDRSFPNLVSKRGKLLAMPELPEVETTCRGIRPHLCGRRVTEWIVRQPRLRWPVDAELASLPGQKVGTVRRRAKYLLIGFDSGTALVHLGMSGSLRLCAASASWRTHDHLALALDDGRHLRYHDPRRFGCWLWTAADPSEHSLLRDLGPEPLDGAFDADRLRAACAGRRRSIKETLMDARTVVGIGNIYACEALFIAGIHPARPSSRIAVPRLAKLVTAAKAVLEHSISQGGTTLRDFLREDGTPGYFRQQLLVYDRANDPCSVCGTGIRRTLLGQRATYYCPRCQR